MLSIDKNILENYTKYFSHIYGYPPCVSKVCAYLIFDFNADGVTFEELLQYFEVSKSSISGALKFLEDKNHVRYFHKDDCRRRYFVINENYIINRYKDIYDNLINEKKLLEKVQNYKDSLGVVNEQLDKKIDTILDIIGRNAENLNNAIQSLSEINNPILISHESNT